MIAEIGFFARLKPFTRDDARGATSIEYSLLASVLAFIIIAVGAKTGSFASITFELVGEKISVAGGGSVSSASADGMGWGGNGEEDPPPGGEGDDPPSPDCSPNNFAPCD